MRTSVRMKLYAHERAHEIICARVCANIASAIRKEKPKIVKEKSETVASQGNGLQNWDQFGNPVLGTAQ